MSQLIIVADMEGASGIFESNESWVWHGYDDWRTYGRECITSDVLAVCAAAVDFGIDDILLYDSHYAGDPEFNVILERLPPIARVFDIPDRCFFWRRIRGQAAQRPFGVVTVGQHTRFGTPDAYFPHTIQSPPIKNLDVNGIHIAEIGTAVLSFDNTPYLANVGCQASMREALELSSSIITIPVKDKAKNWEPLPSETYPLIYQGALKAFGRADKAEIVSMNPPFHFFMELCEGYVFKPDRELSWKGSVGDAKAEWTAPSVEIGLEILNYVREFILSK